MKPYGLNVGNDCINHITRTIKVDGHGSVTAKPDQAAISLGVIVEDKNAQNAQRHNALLSNQVIEALEKIGIHQDDIQTVNYTIDPIYDYIDGQATFRGYRVIHMLKVIIKDISKIGVVIDVATQNGANNISNVEFQVSNREYYYVEALKTATLNARKKAKEIASVLGVNINNIPLCISEISTAIEQRPIREALSVSTPIQEGEIRITAFINAIFQF